VSVGSLYFFIKHPCLFLPSKQRRKRHQREKRGERKRKGKRGFGPDHLIYLRQRPPCWLGKYGGEKEGKKEKGETMKKPTTRLTNIIIPFKRREREEKRSRPRKSRRSPVERISKIMRCFGKRKERAKALGK